ncbi:MAG: hypothetical protein HDS54_07375 [Barnesiella sp.]|nr:hypothetical protein [Bacteroidales bacterium]MBD5235844.1 hypothetical protein [Barnesiella sp.]MBD5247965.1 hypothetical protein [Barnesiella sp.]
MKGATIFRLLCIAALWILICIWYVDRLVRTQTEINLRTLFPIVASGIIIIVPLYKKYFKNTDNGQKNGK